jgi:hypothetical protein
MKTVVYLWNGHNPFNHWQVEAQSLEYGLRLMRIFYGDNKVVRAETVYTDWKEGEEFPIELRFSIEKNEESVLRVKRFIRTRNGSIKADPEQRYYQIEMGNVMKSELYVSQLQGVRELVDHLTGEEQLNTLEILLLVSRDNAETQNRKIDLAESIVFPYRQHIKSILQSRLQS